MLFTYFTAAFAAAGSTLASPVARSMAPLYTPDAPPSEGFGNHLLPDESHIIADSYIVVMHKDQVQKRDEHLSWFQSLHASDVAARDLDLSGLKHEYDLGGLSGYSGHFSEEVLDQIRARPEVAYVEKDTYVFQSEVQKGAPWGLARISHRDPLSFGTFNKYEFEEGAGTGVTAYVIDTGVNIEHVEFEGRAKWGKTIPQNDVDVDANGHGTHVAGTIGSRKYGVAKNASVVAVKVLGSNGSGTMSDVVGGVDWAAKDAAAKAQEAAASNSTSHRGSVANMSLGGGKSIALDEAVNAAVESGLHFAVAAGNDNRDACTFSPAAADGPVTVGASTIADARAYFSNHGKCVDVFAPGLNILSTWNTGNTSTNTISGTSMASPHVAGLLAYFLSQYPSDFKPSDEDFTLAGEPSPYQSSSTSMSSMFVRPAQHVFNKMVNFVGLSTRSCEGDEPQAADSGIDFPKVLSPKVLKNALVRIATEGVLTDLPDNTVDLLIFNNYTRTD